MTQRGALHMSCGSNPTNLIAAPDVARFAGRVGTNDRLGVIA